VAPVDGCAQRLPPRQRVRSPPVSG
jgi:hypothetical protein